MPHAASGGAPYRKRRVFVGFLDSYRGAIVATALRAHGFIVCGCVSDQAVIPKNGRFGGIAGVRSNGTVSNNWAVDEANPSAVSPVANAVILSGLRAACANADDTQSVVWRGDSGGMRRLLRASDDVVFELAIDSAQDVLDVAAFLSGSAGDEGNSAQESGLKRLIVLSSFLSWYATPPLTMDKYEDKRRAHTDVSYTDEKHQDPAATNPSLFSVENEVRQELKRQKDGSGGMGADQGDEIDDPPDVFSEEQYNRRIAHANYTICREVERRIAAYSTSAAESHSGNQGAGGNELKTSIVFSGLCYGWGESLLHPFFRQAWSQSTDGLPIYGSGKQVVPMIHVSDLGRFVARLLTRTLPTGDPTIPRPILDGKQQHQTSNAASALRLHPYYFAVDNSKTTWIAAVKALHRVLGNYLCFRVLPDQYALYTSVEQFTIDLRVDNTRMQEVMRDSAADDSDDLSGGADGDDADGGYGDPSAVVEKAASEDKKKENREKGFGLLAAVSAANTRDVESAGSADAAAKMLPPDVTDDAYISQLIVASCASMNGGAGVSPWVAAHGFARCIERVVFEYALVRRITPLRIMLVGPPLGGKTFLAAELGQRYSLPYFSLADVVAAYRAHLVALEERIEAASQALMQQKLREKRRAAANRDSDKSVTMNADGEDSVATHQGILKDGGRTYSSSKMKGKDGDAGGDTNSPSNGVAAVGSAAAFDDDDLEDAAYQGGGEETRGTEADAWGKESDTNGNLSDSSGSNRRLRGKQLSSVAVPSSTVAGSSSKVVRQLKATQELQDQVKEELLAMEDVQMWQKEIDQVKRVLAMKIGAVPAPLQMPEPPNPRGKVNNSGLASTQSNAKRPSAVGSKRDNAGQAAKDPSTPAPLIPGDYSQEYQDIALALMVRWRLSSKECRHHGYILDGFPNTPEQARLLYELPNATILTPDPLLEVAELKSAEQPKKDVLSSILTGGDSGDKSPPLLFCDDALFPDFIIKLNASDAFLYERFLKTTGAEAGPATKSDPQDKNSYFVNRLQRYKQQVDFAASTVIHFAENACTRPRPPLCSGFRRARIINVDVAADPLVPPPPPTSEFELPPLSRVAQRLCSARDGAIGPPRNFGMTLQQAMREVTRARQLEAQKALKEREATDAQLSLQAKEAAKERSREEKMAADMERMKAQEREALEIRKAPLRAYLQDNILPLLSKGLLEVAQVRPENPVDYLASWLLQHNPNDNMFYEL